MKRQCLIVSCICVLSSSLFAISSAADLVNVPTAILSPKGTVEYGIESRLLSDEDAVSREFDNSFFFEIAFSDRLNYSFESSTYFDTLQSFSAQLAEFSTQKGKPLDHHLAFGFMNMGWQENEAGNTNMPRIRRYVMYSVSTAEKQTNYHAGLANYHNDDNYRFVWGAHHEFKKYTTMAEWDGRQVNFGIKYKLSDTLSWYTSITPLPYTGNGGDNRQYVSIGITSSSDAFKDLFSDREYIDQVREENRLLNERLSVLNAKMDVLREFSSTDFFEEFEQFLLKEHMVEKELEKESRLSIKSALDHMQKGMEFYYRGEYEMALKEYELVISLLPNFPIAYARMGSIYYRMGQLKKADRYWDKALELDPSNDSLKAFLRSIRPEVPIEETHHSQSDDLI